MNKHLIHPLCKSETLVLIVVFSTLAGCAKKNVPAAAPPENISDQQISSVVPSLPADTLPPEMLTDSALIQNRTTNMDSQNIQINKDALKAVIRQMDERIQQNPHDGKAYAERGRNKIELGEVQSGCADLLKARELGITGLNHLLDKYCK
ncbi:MAG: hypothetical protein KatS3mg031_2241 [Chitinophagales bacterium]|nr:MAG: hypothetical protein KatS3mg031_2241 [Chitinophagales bacterium]